MKRKKHDRLPSSYGSVRYLGKNRKNCYAVHPPCTERDEHGRYIRPKAICYTDDWYVGFAVLTAYHAGTYKPGDELIFKQYKEESDSNLDEFCRRLIADYSQNNHADIAKKEKELTFSQVYEQYYEYKFGEHAPKKLSDQSRRSMSAAYGHCKSLHDKIFREIKLEDLQKCLDDCQMKKATVDNIRLLFNQMYKFAVPRDLCDMNYAIYLTTPDAEENEHGVPFTDNDLKILWKHKDDPIVEFILIMCYSGYRISAYESIKVDMDNWYFQGGVKTKAGKDRIVPIHSAIQPLVSARMKRYGAMLTTTTTEYRNRFYGALNALGIEKHTPHDCRHTFSSLCEKYGVREADRKRMMGHSFGSDITNGVYGHRTLEELRTEIEKIEVPL